MPEEQTNTSLESWLKIIAEKTVETANILRTMDSRSSSVSSVDEEPRGILSSLDKFKDSLKSLGITLSSRDRSGKFVKGGSDTALLTLYRTAVNEQKKTIKSVDQVKKSVDKTTSAIKSYSAGASEGISKYLPGKEVRSKTAQIADFMTGGLKPSSRFIDKYLGETTWYGKGLGKRLLKDLSLLRPKNFKHLGIVAGGLMGNFATGELISRPKTLSGKIGGAFRSLVAFEIIEGVKQIGTLIADSYKGLGTNIAYSSRGAQWGANDTRRYNDIIRDARMMGYSGDETREKILEYQKLGLNMEDTRAGMITSKAFGIENIAPKIQQLRRRTDASSRFGEDLSRAFAGLTPLVNKTGLSLNELTDASLGFINSVKGRVDTATATSALDKYGGFVRRGEMSWGDVSNIYNKTQDVSAKGLMLMSRYADIGGYKFESESNLGRAFELRHLKERGQSAEALRYGLRGAFLSQVGTTDVNRISNDDLFRISEFVLPALEMSGLERLPDFKNIINELMNAPTISAETQQRISQSARESDPERIAIALNAIEHPIKSIHDMLYTKLFNFAGGTTSGLVESQARAVLENDERKWQSINDSMNKERVINIYNRGVDTHKITSTPGEKVRTNKR